MNFDHFIDNTNFNEHYCVGVIFSEISNPELHKLLSQMSKSQLDIGNEYFYIFSNNQKIKNDITNIYFKKTAFTNYSREKELSLLNSIKHFICSEEYADSIEMKDKKVTIPSEDSFYFSFSEKDFCNFI